GGPGGGRPERRRPGRLGRRGVYEGAPAPERGGLSMDLGLTSLTQAGAVDDATIQQHVGARGPVGRLGDPAEFGQLVAFLASERAGYITGGVYQIDGGIIRSNV